MHRKIEKIYIRRAGEDMETKHAHTLWVGRCMGISISVINLPVSNNIANSCASLPRNLLLVIPGCEKLEIYSKIHKIRKVIHCLQ